MIIFFIHKHLLTLNNFTLFRIILFLIIEYLLVAFRFDKLLQNKSLYWITFGDINMIVGTYLGLSMSDVTLIPFF